MLGMPHFLGMGDTSHLLVGISLNFRGERFNRLPLIKYNVSLCSLQSDFSGGEGCGPKWEVIRYCQLKPLIFPNLSAFG